MQHQEELQEEIIVTRSASNFPLTHSQKGIFYSEKLYPDTSLGIVAATLRFFSNVDFLLLEKAINLYLHKNDAVRLKITEVDGVPRQYVSPAAYQKFDIFDFQGDINELYKWDEKQTRIPFKIIDSDLFYICLIKINDHDGGLYVKFHHLISDAWTMALLGNDIVEYYTALKNGRLIPEEKKPSFVDYLPREKQYFGSDRFLKDKEYWDNKFENWQEITALKSRKTSGNSTKARRKTLLIPQKLTARIHDYCKQKKVSEFSLFLSALAMYFNRITGKEDLVFGTTFLNRSNAKEKETAGMFANIAVPLRIYIKDEMNFDNFVEVVSKEILTALRHQKYPYDLIVKGVREKNRTSDNLFDVVLTYQNSKLLKDSDCEKYSTRWHFNGHQIESLIINLNDRDNEGRLIIDYDYLTDLFYATEIEFIHQHVINLLWHALDNPLKIISKLEMLSEKEKQKILIKFNDTDADYPKDKTVPQLFAEQVTRTPDHIAVIFRETSLTYRELNEKSNQLAGTLREKGVQRNGIVGIMLNRSLEMVIGIMGILKAGGAYLPIDPCYPIDRINYMLEDCGVRILLTQGIPEAVLDFSVEIIDLSAEPLSSQENSELEHINSPTDLAYVIYTSGSTGQPKGVMIEHRSLINRLNWMQRKYPLNEESVILQKTPFTFDVSVWELIWWSLVGAKVCLLEPGGEKDPAVIIDSINRYGITTLHFVPSMLSIFLHFLEGFRDIGALSSLKQVFASGEALSLQQVKKFNSLLHSTNRTELYNLYGPTEAAIDVSSFDCSPEVNLNSVPIGKPIDNIKMYILDKHLNLLPIAIPGELFIGGVGLSRGYVNKPELTQDRFISNPFLPGEKIYRTGDLARWYSEGAIEYLARLDHQIKIRGFRIELGEIENKLLLHPDIKNTVAVGIQEKDRKYLCAYYEAEKEISGRELKKMLSVHLPEYMIPSFFVKMDSLPLSPNGKIDRKALPQPCMNNTEVEYSPPRNNIEKELANLFKNVLEIDKIGIDDSLFDLGGDSLTVMMIFSRIYDRNWGITAADFYQYPTIRELSEKINSGQKTDVKMELMEIEEMSWETDSSAAGEVIAFHNVLLTGATGFLGSHILHELLENTESCLYCLVRGESNSIAEEKLKQTLSFYFGDKYHNYFGKRIVVVNGDISSDNLGLTKTEYLRLGSLIDTVVHSAAMVRYYGKYSQIEKVNVLGTNRIIDFALQFKIKLNHISTLSVTGNYLVNNSINSNFTENDFDIGQSYLDNIYVRSKFEAERSIFKAVKQGLKATIFRMGNLTGRYSDGHFQRNIEENGFYSAIRSVIKLGVVSEELVNEEMEFTPVDFAAKAIMAILRTKASSNRIFHIYNHNTIQMRALLRILEQVEVAMKIMGKQEMDRFIKNSVQDESMRDVLLGMIVYLKDTGELAYSVSVNVNSDLSVNYLSELGFVWPPADAEYVLRLWRYMRKVNFLTDEDVS